MRSLLAPLDVAHPRESSLRARGAVSLAGLAAQGIVRLLVAVVVGRVAGASVLGVVATAMATAQFLILFGPTTAGQAASRFLARARGRGSTAETGQVAGHLVSRTAIATAVLAATAVPVSLFRGTDPTTAAWTALFLVGVAGQQFTRGVHYGMGAVTRVVVLDIALSVAGLLGVGAALLAGVRTGALLLPLAGAFVVLTLACLPRGTRRDGPRELRREIDRFVFFGSLGTIASAGLVQLSVLVADRLGPTAAGHYAAASNLAIPLTLVSGAMSLVLYPTMAEAFGRGDTEGVVAQLDQGVRGLVFLMTPVVAFLVAASDLLVGLLYGPGFAESVPVLALLLGAVVISMIGVPCVNALTSGGRNGIVGVAFLSLGSLVLAAIVWATTVPVLGLVGVALGHAVGVVTTASVAVLVCLVRWHRPWWGLLAMFVLAMAGVAVLRWSEPGPAWTWAATLVGAGAWVLIRSRERRLCLGLIRMTSSTRS